MKKILHQFLFLLFMTALTTNAKENNGVKRQGLATTQTGTCPNTTAQVDLNVNNVRAKILNGGDLWWDPVSQVNTYEVPIGSGKSSLFSGAIWIGGFDATNTLKVAAQTYRQQGANDFWSGPISKDPANGTLAVSNVTCAQYDRFWKLTKQEVQTFVAGGSPTQSIIDWPGNGNVANNEIPFLAPFFDANNDGIYNYTQGDYPNYNLSSTALNCDGYLSGDQTIWWVFNDIGNVHTETNSDPIGLEIRAQAFAFASSNSNINNTTFYKYQIINRSSNAANQCRIGQWVDPDLGDASDDYVGCDVGRGLGFCYNGDPDDAVSAGGYGLNPPAVGTDFFQGPLADAGDGIDNNMNGTTDEPGEECTMSKFVYYKSTNSTPDGNPNTTDDYYQYLEGKRLDGLFITYGGDGRTNQTNPQCNFMFPGTSDPSFLGNDWTMAIASIVPNDMRYLQSAGTFTLDPGEVNYVSVAALWARGTAGPLSSVMALKAVDDDAQSAFDNCFSNVGIKENESISNVACSPNPFSDQAIISFINPNQQSITLRVFNLTGKLVIEMKSTNNSSFKLERGELNTGVYLYRLISGNKSLYTGKIVVQ